MDTPVNNKIKRIKPNATAGKWFSANKALLETELSSYIENAKIEKLPGRLKAIISPHAGYTHSGQTAAIAYKHLIDSDLNTFIILAPSHTAYFKGASIPDYTHYETPLGEVSIDLELCSKLLKTEYFNNVKEAHIYEHSLEIQLPFIQMLIKKDFKIVPIVLSELSSCDFEEIAKLIKNIMNDKTIIIASGDFTHYGENFSFTPFIDNIRENISNLDLGAIDLLIKKDFEGFRTYLSDTKATICGRNPFALLTKIFENDETTVKLLDYRLSGDTDADYSLSVSYGALVYYK
ncbi:MAG: AmmeMemoRadiSam system protein B [Pseudomonadota bacterium]